MSAFTRARRRALRTAIMSKGIAVALAAAILASGGGISTALITAQPAQAASTQLQIDAAVSQILSETNAERAKVGLQPLRLAPAMNSVAQNWSQAMAAKQSMTHNAEYPWQLPQPWMRVGENVGQGYTTSTIVAAWMASYGHKANILGDFSHIGLGYWVDDRGRAWFTQNFGKYEVLTNPSVINEPTNVAGKSGFTSSWEPKPDETVTNYKIQLYSADGAVLLNSKTTTSPTVTYTGLTEGTGYVVKVTAVGIDVPGLIYSSPVKSFTVTTLEDLPAVTAPTGLTLTSSETSVAASWSAPATAYGILQPYKVELRKGATLVQAAQTTEPKFAFNGLASNTEYTVNVTASTTLKAKTATATATKTTRTSLSSVAQVSEPTTVAVAADTYSTIKATWGAPATKVGTGLKYKLTLSTVGRPDTAVEIASTSYVFTGLAANTPYTVKIQASITAENGVNASTSNGVLTNVKTPLNAEAVSVSAPVLQPVAVEPRQATLRWSAPTSVEGRLVDYTVTVKQAGQPNRVVNTTSTDFSVAGLLENTTYTFEVRANAASLNGTKFASSSSAPATHTTPYAPATVQAPNPPTGFQAASVTHNAASLSWIAPAVVGRIADYTMTVKEAGKADRTVKVTGTSHTLGGLAENSSYTVQVAANAVSSDGSNAAASPSASVAVRTPYPPSTVKVSAPTGLVLSNITANALTASWAPPTGTVGSITGYKVTLTQGTTLVRTTTVAALNTTLNGLTDSTDYRVEVTALAASPDKTQTAASAPAGVNVQTLAGAPFTDVAGSVFYKEIAWMKAKAISTGYDDGTYRPFAPVIREAMAAFMYRMAGKPAYTPPAVSPYVDVPTSHVFYKEIAWMKGMGLANGWIDGTYRPFDVVTREQMAAFMHRYSVKACSVDMPVSKSFVDSRSSVFAADIGWMGGAGVSTGYDDGTYRPFDFVTREQMAAFMYRLDGHIAANGGCRRP